MLYSALDLVLVYVLGSQPTRMLFLVDAAMVGFLWLFILPLMVVLIGGIALLAGSLGPSVAALLISPGDSAGALWLGAICLLLCLALATALRLLVKPEES